MGYTQLITPDPGVTTRPGWCLEFVKNAFGTPIRYPSATAAWEGSATKHRDYDFPEGVWVPIWFSLEYEPNGHVALRAPDGTVYSTTSPVGNRATRHPNLAHLIRAYARNNPLTYLGWTEDVENTPVIAPATITPQAGTVTPQPGPPGDKMLVLATNGTDPQVWIGDGITRRPIWTVDTMHNTQWLITRNLIGPALNNGEIQTIPDLNAIGIDVMALQNKGVNG